MKIVTSHMHGKYSLAPAPEAIIAAVFGVGNRWPELNSELRSDFSSR